MDKKLKIVAIAFAKFLNEDCTRNGNGWCLDECLDENVGIEFELEELYDYWIQKILSNN